jgi:hypothetical protein
MIVCQEMAEDAESSEGRLSIHTLPHQQQRESSRESIPTGRRLRKILGDWGGRVSVRGG